MGKVMTFTMIVAEKMTVKHLLPQLQSLLQSDLQLNSPYEIPPQSHRKVTRVKEMMTNQRNSLLLNKFFLSEQQDVYKEQCGEYAY